MIRDIKEYTLDELRQYLAEEDIRPFTAVQIFQWLYQKGADDFEAMTNVSKETRAFLAVRFGLDSLALIRRQVSTDGTEKYLFGLKDKHSIETVMIPEGKRRTLCVSTQVGCKFKCGFCLSGTKGFTRNLEVSEIIGQITGVNKLIAPERITNIVFMGVGEPLDNFDNLIRAIKILRERQGLNFGRRKVCVSSMGLIPAIRKLAGLDLGIKFSLSLHSADQKTRDKLMPGSIKYPLKDLIKAVADLGRGQQYPVTFEYIMIRGVNSSPDQARALARLIRPVRGKVNLIPYNPSPYFQWQAPSREEIEAFGSVLREQGVTFTLRKPRGQDISASCGQLRMDSGH